MSPRLYKSSKNNNDNTNNYYNNNKYNDSHNQRVFETGKSWCSRSPQHIKFRHAAESFYGPVMAQVPTEQNLEESAIDIVNVGPPLHADDYISQNPEQATDNSNLSNRKRKYACRCSSDDKVK